MKCFNTADLGNLVGLDQSVISRLLNAFVIHLNHLHARRLFDNLDFFKERFPYYNQKLVDKLFQRGDMPPDFAGDIALFTDGTRIQICQPDGRHYVEREFYHGKDKIHCLAFQVTTGIDGMIVDLLGGFPGSRHDSHVFRKSMLNRRLSECQRGIERHFKTYADKGYYNDTHIHASHHEGANVQLWQLDDNRIMSPTRIGVEWGIGKVYVVCFLIKHVPTMKIQKSPLTHYVFSAALMTNIHTCVKAGRNATYFNCLPPTLESYLS
jgi:hypothetical protein